MSEPDAGKLAGQINVQSPYSEWLNEDFENWLR